MTDSVKPEAPFIVLDANVYPYMFLADAQEQAQYNVPATKSEHARRLPLAQALRTEIERGDCRLTVPPVFLDEVLHIMQTAGRRNRNDQGLVLDQSAFDRSKAYFIRMIYATPPIIKVDEGDYYERFTLELRTQLCRTYGFGSWDGHYFQLAQRLQARLATFDGKLARAAADNGLGYW